jgi:hypothetical protein
MGSLQAVEMAEMLEIDSAIAWHLQSNHYPPVPASMVQPCIEAIRAVNEEYGNFTGWHKVIQLPDGITFRGEKVAPAWEIIEQHHLDAWIEIDEVGLED